MRGIKMMAVAAMLSLTGAALAQPKPEAPADPAAAAATVRKLPQMGRATYIDSMENLSAHVTDLLGDQTEKLQADYDARTEELADLLNRSRGLNDAMPKEQLAAFMAKNAIDRAMVMAAHEFSVRSILTPEQGLEWESWKLQQQAAQRFFNAQLTADQMGKISDATKAAAKEILTTKDAQSAEEAKGRFWKTVVSTILTDEQAVRFCGIEGMGRTTSGTKPAK